MRIKSNRYKCRNLPSHYNVNETIKTKPMTSMMLLGAIGITLIVNDENARMLGFVFLGFSIYFIFFGENKTAVEFSDHFMVVYCDNKSDECYLLYYDEVLNYQYKKNLFDTDTILFDLINQSQYELKSLDRRKMLKNVQKYIRCNQLEDDE